MNVAFDDVVMHESINDIGGFAFGRADDVVMPQEVTLVDEGVGTNAGFLAEILKGVVGVERLHGYAVFLAVSGGV